MSRARCRKCWTWHGSGVTVCPRCGAPVGSGYSFVPPDAATQPPPPVVFRPAQPGAAPTPPGTVRGKAISGGAAKRRLGAIAVVGVVCAVITLLLILQLSARAESAHSTLSVKTPSGWERFTGASLPDGTATTNDLMVFPSGATGFFTPQFSEPGPVTSPH